MKPYIELHGIYTEEELCVAYNITHAKFRREHHNPPEKLPNGAISEIFNNKERDLKIIAVRYKTTIGQARRAIANAPNITPTVDRETVKAYKADGLSNEAIAKQLGISLNQVKATLRQKRSTELGVTIRTTMATGLYTQAELAAELGISQSTISYYQDKKTKRPNRPKLDSKVWDALIAEYKTGNISITELARKYRVGRATIYRRVKLCASIV